MTSHRPWQRSWIFDEPEFVKLEPESFEYHRPLAGLGASGLEVNILRM